MIDNMARLQQGLIDDVNPSLLWPLNEWLSGKVDNVKACNEVNKLFFFVKPKILLKALHLHTKSYSKYPKAVKEENLVLEIISPYLQKVYGWSKLELRKNYIVVRELSKKKEFLQWLNKVVGFEGSECKKLGLIYNKVDEKVKPASKGVFEFA